MSTECMLCKLCHTKLKYCNSNTSNMRAHMSGFHPGKRLKPVIPPNQRTLHEVASLRPAQSEIKKSPSLYPTSLRRT